VKITDVMLVHNDCLYANWKLVVIEDLVKGNDGLVCSATIHTKNGVTCRLTLKLYLLEVPANDATSIRRQLRDRRTRSRRPGSDYK